jgi:hypothetical protein
MCITGSVGTASVAAIEGLLGLLPLYFVVQAEARALACRLSGIGVWLGKGLNIQQFWIHAQLMELDPAFQMGQDKMKPKIALGAPFKVQNPLHDHGLSTWPMTLAWRADLVYSWVQNG